MTGVREQTAAEVGKHRETGERIVLPYEHRTQHISIIGKTGYGKTTLLKHLILNDLRNGTSAILIDPHGDLSLDIISLASPEDRERITLIEEWPEAPFRLNLLECLDLTSIDRTVGGIITLFKRLFNEPNFAPLLELYLDNALRTLIPNNQPLAAVLRLFWDKPFRDSLLPQVTNPAIRQWWASYYEQLSPRDRTEQLQSTVNRLNTRFLSSQVTRAMVDSSVTTAPLSRVLEEDGQLLLLRIPVGELGDQKARFYGSLFLSLLTDQLFARSSQATRHRLHLYLDEYGWFATSTTAALLQQARKYNVGATIACQTLADLLDEKIRASALQVGTLFTLQLTGQDADELASEFPVIPREETVWEKVGTKYVTAPSPNPVDDLTQRTGHTDQHVTDAVQAFLRPLQDRFEESNNRRPGPYGLASSPPISASGLQQAIRLIDQLLITVMKQGRDVTDDHIASLASDVFIWLGANLSYYPFPAQAAYGIMRDSSEFKEKLARHLQLAAQATDPATYFMDSRPDAETPWTMLIASEHQRLREIHEGTLSGWEEIKADHSSDPKRKANADHWIKDSKEWFAQETQKYTDEISQAADLLEPDAAHLIIICRMLAVDPVRKQTAQQEDDLRPNHIRQTHADARVELAGILATLPRFTAYHKTPDSLAKQPETYGHIALAEPPPGQPDEAAIEHVRERSKELYGVPIESDPLPEIHPPNGPRIGRRSPHVSN